MNDISPDRLQAYGPFAICKTDAEVILACHRLSGMEAVEQLLARLIEDRILSREALREAADSLQLVGLRDIASTIRRHARRAQSLPRLCWQQRMQERRLLANPRFVL